MRRKQKVNASDIFIMVLAMVILVFTICMCSGIHKYINNGFFRAVQMAWTELADTVLGIDRYIPDVEIPIVNCHVSLVSYMR